MIFIGYIILFVYVSLIALACIGFIKGTKSQNAKIGLDFSIVIAFRNEEERIDHLLFSLEKSDLEKVNLDEVIFVNDHSTDSTVDKINNWNNHNKFKVRIESLNHHFGKKRAIHLGIEKALSTYVLTLDADVEFDPNLLFKISQSLTANHSLIIVPVIEKNGVIFSRIASHALSVLSVGFASLGIPINLNGAASAFKREEYIRLDPLKNNFQISSGDDMFILKAFLKCKECVVKPLISKGIYVLTDGPKNIMKFISRGVRWSSKMRFIKLPLINLIGIFILMCNFYVYYFILYHPLFSATSILWLSIKFFMDLVILYFSFFLYDKREITIFSIPMFLIYPLYLFTITVLNLFQFRPNWKDRPVIATKSV